MRVKYKIEIYRDSKGEYRWRIKRSGRIVADCAEGYKRRGTMIKTVTHLVTAIQENNFWIPVE